MLEAIDLFRESDTLDELGLGAIRDALADRFFPGTSTIQTRLRYFLFVPWVFAELAARRVRRASAVTELRRIEVTLIESLRSGLEGKAAGQGLVGVEAGARTKRLPVSIYWNGTRSWGIRRLEGGVDQCAQTVNAWPTMRMSADGDEIIERQIGWWDTEVPSPPEGWLESATFTLTAGEADYVRSRIVQSHPTSMLAHLANQRRRPERAQFVWELAEARARTLPPKLQSEADHAEAFSSVMYGATLLYNLILAELTHDDYRTNSYNERLSAWRTAVRTRDELVHSWRLDDFWDLILETNPRVSPATRTFVSRWFDVVRSTHDIASSKAARELIYERERRVKGSQARVDNRRALDMFSGSSGLDQLGFRWPNARRLLDDLASTGGGRNAGA